jgi:hypothetical protein
MEPLQVLQNVDFASRKFSQFVCIFMSEREREREIRYADYLSLIENL